MHAHEDVQVDVRLCKGQVYIFKVYLERCVGEDVCVCMSGRPWRGGARR